MKDALKKFWAEVPAAIAQYVVMFTWALCDVGVRLCQLAGRYCRKGYVHVMLHRRRVKGDPIWQEHDWQFLNILPPPDHPRYKDFQPIEVMSEAEMREILHDDDDDTVVDGPDAEEVVCIGCRVTFKRKKLIDVDRTANALGAEAKGPICKRCQHPDLGEPGPGGTPSTGFAG